MSGLFKKKQKSTSSQTSESKTKSKATRSQQKLGVDAGDFSVNFNPATGSFKLDRPGDLVGQRQGLVTQLTQTNPIGVNNPQVQNILASLNEQVDLGADKLITKASNRTTANREGGSSFEAFRQASLGAEVGQAKAGNFIKALQAASGLQQQNVSQNQALISLINQSLTPSVNPFGFLGMGDITTTGDSETKGKQTGVTTSTQKGSIGDIIASLAGSFVSGMAGVPKV